MIAATDIQSSSGSLGPAAGIVDFAGSAPRAGAAAGVVDVDATDQSIVELVELALAQRGVERAEARSRAEAALTDVGLAELVAEVALAVREFSSSPPPGWAKKIGGGEEKRKNWRLRGWRKNRYACDFFGAETVCFELDKN